MDLSQSYTPNNGVQYLNLDYIFGKIYQFFTHLFDPFSIPTGLDTTIKFILAIFTIFFIFVISYCVIRLFEVRKKEHEYYHHEIEAYRRRHAEDEINARKSASVSSNTRWDAVLQYLFSISPSDWRLAIIEADSMLDGLLDQLGFKRESLGDKLKAADQETFKKLTAAWEVHTVRNKIAHEGVDFELSHNEAKRIIAIYEDIFRQYGYI